MTETKTSYNAEGHIMVNTKEEARISLNIKTEDGNCGINDASCNSEADMEIDSVNHEFLDQRNVTGKFRVKKTDCDNHASLNSIKLEGYDTVGIHHYDACSKKENPLEANKQELILKSEEINIKADQMVSNSPQENTTIVPTSLDQVEEHELRCTRQRNILPFKCHVCGYETPHRSNLRQHSFVHKDVSEVTTYKCETCPYETPHKGNLKQHSLVHGTTNTFNCQLCSYKTVRKANLKQHMLTHRNKSAGDVVMLKCDVCLYETPRKGNLKQHLLIHSDVSNLKMHKCKSCAYETPHKSNLTTHELVHKDVSEVKMYRCEICAYKTKRKSSLKSHMLVHESAEEITGYTCELGVASGAPEVSSWRGLH